MPKMSKAENAADGSVLPSQDWHCRLLYRYPGAHAAQRAPKCPSVQLYADAGVTVAAPGTLGIALHATSGGLLRHLNTTVFTSKDDVSRGVDNAAGAQ